MNQLILTLVFYVWMFGVLVLLWIIWRKGAKRTQMMEAALADTAIKASEAAQRASEAARTLAHYVEDAQKDHPP